FVGVMLCVIFGGVGRTLANRGSDLRYTLELDLEEAVRGTTVKIRVPTHVECGTCHATGAEPGTHAETCGTCHGSGQIRMQQGFFSVQQTCPRCRGAGKTIRTPCKTCHGVGYVEEQKTLSVKVPPGVDRSEEHTS